MLVYRPTQLLLKYKGHEVIMRSENHTEDSTKFDKDALELRILILNAMGDFTSYENP